MFKSEEKLVIFLSAGIFSVLLLFLGVEFSSFPPIYLVTVPLYLWIVCCCNNLCDSRERVDDAVSFCLEESDFNVIDKIEKLRLYFSDTKDVINYLSVVDSRVLSFAFDERNMDLNYKEYIVGAVRCLCSLKSYTGCCYFNINTIELSDSERVGTLLSTLYMVSKHIERDCSSISITSKLSKGKVVIDVIDQFHNSMNNDKFCEKLFSIFSSDHLILAHSSL